MANHDGANTSNVGTDTGADLTRDITLDILMAYERKVRFVDRLRVDSIPDGAAAGSFIIEGKEDRTDGALTEYGAGTQVAVSNGTQDEIIVPLDRPQYESRRVDKWREAVARYDVVGMNVRQLGTRLANAIDRKMAAAVELASLSTGLVANGDGTVVTSSDLAQPIVDPEAFGKAFAQAIYAAVAAMQENDVDEEIYVACSPSVYSTLPQSFNAVNKDFTTDNGGYDTGLVKMIGGAEVFSTNNLPTTADLVALVFSSEAAGMAKLWDIQIDINPQPEYLNAKLINAYFSNGVKPLRPQCAASIKYLAP